MATIKGLSQRRGFWAILSACVVFSLIAVIGLTVLFPFAAVSPQIVNDLRDVPEHMFQYVKENCTFYNITNGYSDFTTNIDYGEGFGFVLNSQHAGGYVSGLAYDGRHLKDGDNHLGQNAWVTFCIPNGAYAVDANYGGSENFLRDDRFVYYDVKVTISNIMLSAWTDFTSAGTKPSNWGAPSNKYWGNRMDWQDDDWRSTDLVCIIGDGVGGGSPPGDPLVRGSNGKATTKPNLIGMYAYSGHWLMGVGCDITISIINHSDNWRTASPVNDSVSYTIPMAYDDIDIPDWLTWARIEYYKDTEPGAQAVYDSVMARYESNKITHPEWNDGQAMDDAQNSSAGRSSDSRWNMYDGPYKEAIEFKSGITPDSSNVKLYLRGDNRLRISGNRVSGSSIGNSSVKHYAGMSFLASANESVVRWTGSGCWTWLFDDIGYYDVTMVRTDNYGMDVGRIKNGSTDSTGKYSGVSHVFPGGDTMVWASVLESEWDKYYIASIKSGASESNLTEIVKNTTIEWVRWHEDTYSDYYYHVRLAPYLKVTTLAINGTIDDDVTGIMEGEGPIINYRPNPGYYLEYIWVDGRDVDLDTFKNSYDFTNMTVDHQIVVGYAAMYNIETKAEHGKIDPKITNIQPGETKTVTYEPDDGYFLAHLYIDDVEISTVGHETSYTFSNINANHKIRVVFEPMYKITTDAIHGTITPDVTGITPGTNKTITYQAEDGYFLSHIYVDGSEISISGHETSYTFTNIQSDHHIQVVYDPMYKITTSALNGRIDDDVTKIGPGESRTITYNPYDGYFLARIYIDGTLIAVTGHETSYTFTNIHQDHTIRIECDPMYNIRTYVEHGTITPDITKIPPGENRTVTYSPDTGYFLSHIYVDGSEISVSGHETSYTFRNIHEDHVIRVIYEPMAILSIASASNDPNITNGNSLYHFTGLTYEVRDKDGNVVDRVTANRNGTAVSTGYLLPGTYTVWSTNGNGCYKTAVRVGTVTLGAGDRTTITMYHPAVHDPGTIIVDKDWA